MMNIKTTVYADVLFLVNFSMDFITLWISAVLTSRPRRALRMSLGASVGALYAFISLFIPTQAFLTYIIAGGVSILMCLITFGSCGGLFGLIRQSALIWGCGALLGGTMTAILSLSDYGYNDTSKGGGILSIVCAASVASVYIIIRIICNIKNKRTVSVSIIWKDTAVSFSALCDSGNLMRDPISGDPVMPVSEEIIEKLCKKCALDALYSLDSDKLAELQISPRLIPIRTIDKEGMICGFVPDRVTVISGSKRKDVRCIIAPKKCKKDYFAGHSASIPASLIP